MTDDRPRDENGRWVRTRPPDYIIETDAGGHLRSVHGNGWRFDAQAHRVPARMQLALAFSIGFALAAILAALAVAR